MENETSFNCEICKRKSDGIRCIIFHYIKDVFGEAHPGVFHSYPTGKHILSCIECNMCYSAQFYKQSNKEIEDWVEWVLKI